MKLQYYSDGARFSDGWVDAFSREDEFVREAAAYNKTTEDEIRKKLNNGEEIYYEPGWSYMIRSLSAKERLEKDLKPKMQILCDCGHYVLEGCVMTTGRGTSCSECYSRMSI